MSNLHLPDETLMAYADGELASDVANAVETAMEDDASLVGRVVAFMRVRRLTRTAAATVAMPMAPQAAIDLIERRVAARRRGLPPRPAWVAGRRLAIRWAAPALAACLGVVATLAATQWRQQAASVVGEPWLAHLSDPALPAALSSLPTGSERALASGVVRAVASYAPSGGDLCREFDLVAENSSLRGRRMPRAGDLDASICGRSRRRQRPVQDRRRGQSHAGFSCRHRCRIAPADDCGGRRPPPAAWRRPLTGAVPLPVPSRRDLEPCAQSTPS